MSATLKSPNPSYIRWGRKAHLAGGFINDKFRLNGIRVVNKTGAAIAINKLVAILGYDSTVPAINQSTLPLQLPKIVLANANTATHTDVYAVLAAIPDGAEGFVFKGGLSSAVLDTSGVTTVGDPVYLDTVAGGFTATAPTGASNHVIRVGWADVKSATIGKIHWDIGQIEKYGDSSFQSGMTINGATIGTISTLSQNNVMSDYKVLAADFTANSGGTGATLTSLTGMSWTVTAAGKYAFEFEGPVNMTVNGGLSMALKYTTATMTGVAMEAIQYTASTLAVAGNFTTATDQAKFIDQKAVAYTAVKVTGYLNVNAGGTVALQAAQNTAHVDTTTIYAGFRARMIHVS